MRAVRPRGLTPLLAAAAALAVPSFATAAPAAEPVTMSTKFDVTWFDKTEGYRAIMAALARPDPNVPGISVAPEELRALLGRVEIGASELKWVERYASPLSRKKQRQRVRSVRKVLLSKRRLAAGAKFATEHRDLLDKVSAQYDVAVSDLLAMLNAESNFGTVQGTFVVFDVFVAQIAYLNAAEHAAFGAGDYDKADALTRKANQPRVERRRRYAVRNISALLRYAKLFEQDPRTFKGSWAGAIGMTQFMPASLRWAKDGDGDGKVDLGTVPDAVASTANYLVEHGYVRTSRKARRKAFKAYNPNSEYVSAIDDYARRFEKRAARR